MKIHYQYSTVKTFRPIKGDYINEYNTLLALSMFNKVYFSGSRVFADKKTFNPPKDYPETIVTRCLASEYDAYIIRANAKLFRAINSKNKFWIASPYNKQCFEEAKAIITFTKAWEDTLRKGIQCSLNPDGIKYKNVITFHQTINPAFKPLQSHEKTKRIRKSFGGEFIIGYLGKIKTSDKYLSFIRVINRVKEKYPGAKFIIGSTNKIVDSEGVFSSKFNYFDIPYVISACDLTISDGASALGGKLKTLESMACGVPIISPRYRKEQLGKKYPLLYDRERSDTNKNLLSEKSEEQIYQIIINSIENPRFVKNQSRYLLKKSKFYSLKESSERLRNDLKRLVK